MNVLSPLVYFFFSGFLSLLAFPLSRPFPLAPWFQLISLFLFQLRTSAYLAPPVAGTLPYQERSWGKWVNVSLGETDCPFLYCATVCLADWGVDSGYARK